jgi:predicted PurR-regulated permease PerM
VEEKVSRYLLTISMVNIAVGVVVGTLMAIIGMPSPVLWGALAAVLNYIPFVGQAVMALILFLVGLGTQSGLEGAILPVGLYWLVNFFEGNFVTPNLLGRTMMMNPFLIFLSLAFWIWAWGPVGGLVAVPSLLILYSFATNILPMRPRQTRRIEHRPKIVDTRGAIATEHAKLPARKRTPARTAAIR